MRNTDDWITHLNTRAHNTDHGRTSNLDVTIS